jgi:serine/threonine protein kinase
MPPHPNVVRTIASEVGCDDRSDVVVLEWVEGQSLRHIVEHSGPLALDAALSLVEQVAAALLRFQQGIPLASGELLPCSHGNVHPRWILVTGGGQASEPPYRTSAKLHLSIKLGGWGLGALKPEAGDKRWRDQVPIMAPEVLRGEQPEPNVAGDVFAIAAVLHYTLTGRGLYGADLAPEAVLRRVRRGEPSIEATLPSEVARFIVEFADFDPKRRPSLPQVTDALSGLSRSLT